MRSKATRPPECGRNSAGQGIATVERVGELVAERAKQLLANEFGGKKTLVPIGELVRGILRRRKHIYLCTNGMFIQRRLHEFRPTSRFFFNVHLDGLEETHDRAVERTGVFRAAVEGIKAAKKAGFLVCTNTTVFKETDMDEIDALYEYLTSLGVDGFMLSPSYGYVAVQQTNPDGAAEIFLTREDIRAKFQEAQKLLKNFDTSSLHYEILMEPGK